MYGLTAPMSPEPYRRETAWVYSQGAPAVFKGDLYYYSVDHDVTETAKTIDTRRVSVDILNGEYDWSGTPAARPGTRGSDSGRALSDDGRARAFSDERESGAIPVRDPAGAGAHRESVGVVNATPFESLDYLYLPAPDIDASVAFYTTVLGGELLWKIHDASTWVAAVRLTADGPAVVLADHLAPGRGLLIYRVRNLADSQRALVERGWSAESESVELPQGPCRVFQRSRRATARHL